MIQERQRKITIKHRDLDKNDCIKRKYLQQCEWQCARFLEQRVARRIKIRTIDACIIALIKTTRGSKVCRKIA